MTTNIDKFRGKYSFLSNFHLSKIKYKGKVYKTAEHLFQALKCRNAVDHERIRNADTPVEAKQLGRIVDLIDNWELVKDAVMLMVITMKFNQNKGMYHKLMSTENSILYEGNNWHDNYWGGCNCAKCNGLSKSNKLGELLMLYREMNKFSKVSIDTCKPRKHRKYEEFSEAARIGRYKKHEKFKNRRYNW